MAPAKVCVATTEPAVDINLTLFGL
jgi:hypothetical protein